MKTIAKLISINDGESDELQNGEYMHVEKYPRTEAIISGFLSDGWTLHSRNFRTAPTLQRPGDFTFFLDGWDLLFVKEVEDTAPDNGDELLDSILTELGICVTAGDSDEDEDPEEDEILKEDDSDS